MVWSDMKSQAAVFLSLATVLASAADVPCQKGDVVDASKNKCYLVFSDVTANRADALAICLQHGATLAKTEEWDHKFLINSGRLDLSKHYWLGMNDFAKENTWVWTDNSPVTWFIWRPGQPNNDGPDGQQCVCLDYNQEWQDKNCNDDYRFICERVANVSGAYVRHDTLRHRKEQKKVTESCDVDCVLRCDVTADCLGMAFNPREKESNCCLYALRVNHHVTLSAPWQLYDKADYSI